MVCLLSMPICEFKWLASVSSGAELGPSCSHLPTGLGLWPPIHSNSPLYDGLQENARDRANAVLYDTSGPSDAHTITYACRSLWVDQPRSQPLRSLCCWPRLVANLPTSWPSGTNTDTSCIIACDEMHSFRGSGSSALQWHRRCCLQCSWLLP